jgi:hypothetical protein
MSLRDLHVYNPDSGSNHRVGFHSTARAVLLLGSLDSYQKRPSSDAAGCCVLGEGCSGVS